MKTTISFGRFVKTAMNLKEMYPVQRWSPGIRKVKESSLTILPRSSILVELDGIKSSKSASSHLCHIRTGHILFWVQNPGLRPPVRLQ